MADMIKFEDALKATEGKDRALLIGNGFSAEYFTYSSLLAASGIAAGSALRNVFDALNTVDFEKVVCALEDASIVEAAYGHAARAAQLTSDAQAVREALVKAVNSTHPAHRDELALKYAPSSRFLRHFSSVFSLNYDLLLYWVYLEECKLSDGFGLGDEVGSFRGPFQTGAYCELHNLHGGLHLFLESDGELWKALDRGAGVIATITNTIKLGRRLPVYVAEGTSAQKMAKINSVAYLRHAYEKLRTNGAAMFVYGHSAAENDIHIYRAIFTSPVKEVYFGVHQPDADKLTALDAQLAKYRHLWDKGVSYTFFDSASAEVWG